MCKELFGNRLEEVVDIRGVHDWKNLLLDCRPRSADEDIQLQFSMQLRARADTTIEVRSKAAVSASVPWSPWYQMMPHPQVPEAILPARDQVPSLATSKPWPQFKNQVVPCLKRFYSRAYKHPVAIPPDERQEMLRFLRRGPDPPSPPEWIDWTRGMSDNEPGDASDNEDDRGTARAPASGSAEHRGAARAPASAVASLAGKKQYHAFLAPRENPDGKKCRYAIGCDCTLCTRTHTCAHAWLSLGVAVLRISRSRTGIAR